MFETGDKFIGGFGQLITIVEPRQPMPRGEYELAFQNDRGDLLKTPRGRMFASEAYLMRLAKAE